MADLVHVGLDLSLTGAGIAVLAPGRPLFSRTVKSPAGSGRIADRYRRLHDHTVAISTAVWDGIGRGSEPRRIRFTFEAPSFASKNGNPHERAGLWWMVAEWALSVGDTEMVEVPPATLKKFATSKGNADKPAMGFALARDFADVTAHPGDDETDAIWLAMMSRYREDPTTAGVRATAYRDDAVKAVAW